MANHLKYTLYVLLSALAGAAGLIGTEVAVRAIQIPVVHIAVLSNLVAGGLLLAWAAITGAGPWTGWGRADWFRLAFGALAIFAAGFLLLYEAIDLIGTSKAALLGRLETIFIVLLAVLFLREAWTPRHLLGGLTALAGAVLVNFDPGAWSLDLGWGEILSLCSALSFATGIILLKSVLNRHSGLLVTGYGLVLGALFMSPFLFVLKGEAGDGWVVDGWSMGLLFVRGGLLATSWIYYNVAMQHLGASRCSILFLSTSFMAVLLQVTLDAVVPSMGLQVPSNLGLAVLGGVVICGGIYFVSKAPKSRTA